MIHTPRTTAFALVFLLAGCGVASAPIVESSETPSPDDTAPTPVTTAGGSGSEGALLLPTADRLDAIAKGAGVVELPEGTFPLGYVPTPVEIPQPELEPAPWSVVSAELPASYDLRELGRVTAVRDQGTCGSCWAFASYASGESALRPDATWDFSEEHLNLAHGFDIRPCNGGNAQMSTGYMARGAGPALEADAPYTGRVVTPPLVTPKRVLREALTLPNRASATDNDTLKRAIRDYGAIYTSMNWNATSWRGASAAFYDAGPRRAANHAVALVGWNDDYPKASFAKVPPTNGAFLVRNSWGRGFGDGGYFWISYHDAYVGRENMAFASFGETGLSDATYQLDRYGATSALTYTTATTWSANVHTTSAPGEVESVGFWTSLPSTTVKVTLYEAPTDGAPTSGSLLGTQEISEPFAGYHTVSFAKDGIQLGAKRRFSVVVQVTAPSRTSYVPLEAPFAGYSSRVVATAGTSFVSSDGKAWTDTARTWKANAPLKVFLKTVPNCDDKNACTKDRWDGAKCVNEAVPQGTVCRAAAGPCDAAEVCDGTGAACPSDRFATAGRTCRAAAGACDVAEVCDGKSAACPADKLVGPGTVCRAAEGACDVAEVCTGRAAACPSNGFRARGTVCRAAEGVCDLAETCTGASATCPSDVVAKAGRSCGPNKRVCDGTSKTCN